MPLIPAPPALALRLPSQQPSLEARILAYTEARDWAGLADYFETLSPRERGSQFPVWLQSLNRAQRWERLLQVCEAAIPQEETKVGVKLTLTRMLRAQALSQLQRHAEAMVAHAETGRLGWADGYPNACAEARACRNWPALQANAEAILAKAPGDPPALAWKGEALAWQANYPEAEPLLRAALAADPSQPHPWSNLARCLNERKAFQEAQEACDRALALAPALLEARYNRGRAAFELGKFQEAKDDFQAALALLPGDPVLLENLNQAQKALDKIYKPKKNNK